VLCIVMLFSLLCLMLLLTCVFTRVLSPARPRSLPIFLPRERCLVGPR